MYGFPTAPITIHQDVTGLLYPDSYKAYRKEFNPWNDLTLDLIQLNRLMWYRYAMIRQEHVLDVLNAYAPNQIVMDIESVKLDYANHLYNATRSIEYQYIANRYESELNVKDWHPTDPLALEHDPLQNQLYWIAGNLHTLIRPTTPNFNRIYTALLKSEPPPDIMDRKLGNWYGNSKAIIQHEIYESFNALLMEFNTARVKHNILVGIAAKNRTMLANEHIPTPNLGTLEAWNLLCLLSWKKSRHYEHISRIVFIVPILPVTREHMYGGGSVGAEDAHFNHSLPGKSAAHKRDNNGRIIHGISMVVTALIDSKAGTTSILEINTTMDATRRLIDSDILNYTDYTSINDSRMLGINNPLYDPYMGYDSAMNKARNSYSLDIGFRALSKNYNIHMRFDDHISHKVWIHDYIESWAKWLTLNDTELQNERLKYILRNQMRSTAPATKATKTKGKIFTADLSIFESMGFD